MKEVASKKDENDEEDVNHFNFKIPMLYPDASKASELKKPEVETKQLETKKAAAQAS